MCARHCRRGKTGRPASGGKGRTRNDSGGVAGSIALVPKSKAVQQWDSGAAYDQVQRERAEARFRAREFELRITREQVRQWRKERDPAAQAREAEIIALQKELMDRRRRQQVQVAERSILAGALGATAAAAGTLAAFEPREKLARTQPGAARQEAEDHEEYHEEDQAYGGVVDEGEGGGEGLGPGAAAGGEGAGEAVREEEMYDGGGGGEEEEEEDAGEGGSEDGEDGEWCACVSRRTLHSVSWASTVGRDYRFIAGWRSIPAHGNRTHYDIDVYR